MLDSHKAVEKRLTFLFFFPQGAKSQLYSLLFRQAVPSIHCPESHFDLPHFFMNGIDYISFVI